MAHITSCKKELKTQNVGMETKGEMKWRVHRVLKLRNLDISLAMHTSEFCPLFDISANLIIFPEKYQRTREVRNPHILPFSPFYPTGAGARLQVGKRSERSARLGKEEEERRRKKKGGRERKGTQF